MQLNLGPTIRQLRRRDGRTQEALASALGVTSQAVSRWESGGSYPDMELIPSIANYFGVSIDELFGYSNEREQKIAALASRIEAMRRQNNGTDVNISECIALARESLVEFPGNDRLMLCLASVLYTAGYVRYGEHHLTDVEGYSVYDTQRHRGYAEWQEAITLYEKALENLEEGTLRRQAVDELSQLYVNTGDHAKALSLAEAAPGIWGSREFLRIYACDGKKQAQACAKTLLTAIHACASLIVSGVQTNDRHMTPAEKAQSLRGAVALYAAVCPDGNYGDHHAYIGKIHMLLSLYLWLDGKKDEAFEALDQTLIHFRAYEALQRKGAAVFTAPLVRLVRADIPRADPSEIADPRSAIARLPEDWPWWHIPPEEDQVRQEMEADPRWKTWVAQTQA